MRDAIRKTIVRRRMTAVLLIVGFGFAGVLALQLSGAQQAVPADPPANSDAVTANDPLYNLQTVLRSTKVDQLWQRTTGSESVVIAVISSGIRADHPDIAGKLVAGYDFVNNNTDPTPDGEGNGTAHAGIIGATTNNNLGIAGICWKCKIMPLDIHDEAANSASAARNLAAFNYAVDNGADIIDLGYTYPSETVALTQAIKAAHAKGIVVVGFVHSNGADTANAVSFPATVVSEVISVTGTNDDDSLRSDANFGAKVEVAAPSNRVGTLQHTATGGTGYVSFTSNGAAGAFVAGVAGLLRSAFPQATATDISRAIIETADPCCGNKISGGRINAAKAGDFLANLYPPPASTRGDLNGDGKVNIADLSALLTRWNSTDTAADLNKDGKVGITDLSILLTSWKP